MWLYVVACYSFAVVSYTVSEQTESRVVRIDSGPVRGYKDPNEDIFVYYGIPYAKAPSGPDRFKAPLPPPKWVEPLDAVDTGIVCPQSDHFNLMQNKKNMQEDCLIANVYVPNTKKTSLPVIVYVHGGAFIMGFGDLVTPKKIVSGQEIIVVNFNYRLGAHGFLCLGTPDIPGNAAMKDQVALLRWVKKNIANFGGNPDDVTIAGYSAGSVSVDLLMLSKSAKGLFTKVIPESGANLSPFSIQIDPIKNAKEYGKLLKFDVDDLQALEIFYKSAPYELLQSGNVTFQADSNIFTTPCVEREHGAERFLEDSPFNILKSGDFDKLPVLYGFANMEGTIHVRIFDQMKDLMNKNFAEYMSLQILDLQFKNDEEKVTVAEKIKQFYFKDKPIDEKNILAYVDFVSDILFGCPTLRSVDLQLKAGNNNIYFYEYSFVDNNTPLIPHTEVRGAGHCFQTMAVLDGAEFNVTDESGISEDLKEMKSLMRELWSNFAKYGRPESVGVPVWPPVGDHMSPYMDLKKNPQLGKHLLKERCSFWDEIYAKHYNNPVPPFILSPSQKHNEL
ncbi:pyrethroid hydrolase Ces2a-like isoform X4 [Maniola jurtina]|uniref:pyrethroid hydrolase Ces2a-like isoform X4 n=1 Tax=Maniola jurtina TaxID=191418 RepID=UPI001E68BCB4|nr:pyrethroid hydrolase Ces2a-like isoform X4 [Maniola jurtina]